MGIKDLSTEIWEHCSAYYYLSNVLSHLETPVILIPTITFWKRHYILDEDHISKI